MMENKSIKDNFITGITFRRYKMDGAAKSILRMFISIGREFEISIQNEG